MTRGGNLRDGATLDVPGTPRPYARPATTRTLHQAIVWAGFMRT